MDKTQNAVNEMIREKLECFDFSNREGVQALEFAIELMEEYMDILKELEPNVTKTIEELEKGAEQCGRLADEIEFL